MSRMRGLIWLAAGIVLALIAGFIAYSTMTRVVQTPSENALGEMTTVLAAGRDLASRTMLTQDDLVEIELPLDSVPAGAINTYDEAVGRLTMAPVFMDEPILAQRLLDPNIVSTDGRRALFLAQDEVLMAIPAQDLLSRVGVLKPGDQVDIFYSLPFPENRGVGAAAENDDSEQATFDLLQNVTIVGMVGSVQPIEQSTTEEIAAEATGRPDAVLVTLAPQDALTLKYLIDAGGTLDLVLRAPGMERPFETDPVDIDYLVNRYRIPTGAGR